MRILQLAQFYPPVIGGEERHVRNLSVELGALGHDLHVATLDVGAAPQLDPGVQVHSLHNLGVRVPALYPTADRPLALPMPDPLVTRALSQVVGQVRPDVVHAHFFMSGLVAMQLKEALGVPFVVTFHALGLVRKLHQGAADEFPAKRITIEGDIVRAADVIVAECPDDRRNLVTLYDADPHKVAVIPCGFACDEFWPIAPKFARRALGLPSDVPVILSVGRLHRLEPEGRPPRVYSMIFEMGNSTIPVAPMALSRGMIVRTMDSSRIVLTATQSGSDSEETVGSCRAVSVSST